MIKHLLLISTLCFGLISHAMLKDLIDLHDPIVTFYNDSTKNACVEVPFNERKNFCLSPGRCLTSVFSKKLVNGAVFYHFEGELTVKHVLTGHNGISILFRLQ
jgi:hypothetical protein